MCLGIELTDYLRIDIGMVAKLVSDSFVIALRFRRSLFGMPLDFGFEIRVELSG